MGDLDLARVDGHLAVVGHLPAGAALGLEAVQIVQVEENLVDGLQPVGSAAITTALA